MNKTTMADTFMKNTLLKEFVLLLIKGLWRLLTLWGR